MHDDIRTGHLRSLIRRTATSRGASRTRTSTRSTTRRWVRALALLVPVLASLTPIVAQAAPTTKLPKLSVDDAVVAEGDSGTTEGVFTVTLSAPPKKDATVDYATVDGSATAGGDYTPVSGTLVFARGETTQQVSVPVKGDTDDEPDETFFVELSNPDNAVIQRGTGEATIEDDDEPILHTLTVSNGGGGSGAVTSNPAGIDCGSDCTNDYTHGTQVTLTATPASGSTFTGWSGDCTGTGPCTVTMDADKNVTATFDAPMHTLQVTCSFTFLGSPSSSCVEGTGVVTSSPPGINCGSEGSDCTEDYAEGTIVELTATTSDPAFFTFEGWTGDCAGQANPCTLVMDADKSAGAVFG